jgi:predicted dienelactone hydrolase
MMSSARDILLCAIIAVTLAVPGGLAQAEEKLSIAGLDVTVWQPEQTSVDPMPTIIFSHGFHGCATQSSFLMKAFAAAGYLVFAPNHRDATCAGGKARWIDRPERPFGSAEAWDETIFQDRADDVRRLIAALEHDAKWKRRIDLQRLALAGHSLGGYTALGLGGAWPGWKMAGVKAILALSPYVQPFVMRETLSGLTAPVMFQDGAGGSALFTPTLHQSVLRAYALSPSPKYYVEMRGAGHMAWTDLRQTDHAAIIRYSLAFLDHYVRGGMADPLLTEASSEDATLRHEDRPQN